MSLFMYPHTLFLSASVSRALRRATLGSLAAVPCRSRHEGGAHETPPRRQSLTASSPFFSATEVHALSFNESCFATTRVPSVSASPHRPFFFSTLILAFASDAHGDTPRHSWSTDLVEDFLLTVPVIPVMALLRVAVKAIGIAHPLIWFAPRVSVYRRPTSFCLSDVP